MSIPASKQEHDTAAHVLVAEPFTEQLDAEQVGDQVVGRFGHVLGDALVEVGVELVAEGDPFIGRDVDGFEGVVDELAEQVVVLERQAEHAGDDVDGNVLGVVQRGIEDGVACRATMAPARSAHRRRISGSQRSIAFGENGGRRIRRAWWWNGGSLVIGGAPPIGPSGKSSIVPRLTTTPRLVKCSVS